MSEILSLPAPSPQLSHPFPFCSHTPSCVQLRRVSIARCRLLPSPISCLISSWEGSEEGIGRRPLSPSSVLAKNHPCFVSSKKLETGLRFLLYVRERKKIGNPFPPLFPRHPTQLISLLVELNEIEAFSFGFYVPLYLLFSPLLSSTLAKWALRRVICLPHPQQ